MAAALSSQGAHIAGHPAAAQHSTAQHSRSRSWCWCGPLAAGQHGVHHICEVLLHIPLAHIGARPPHKGGAICREQALQLAGQQLLEAPLQAFGLRRRWGRKA